MKRVIVLLLVFLVVIPVVYSLQLSEKDCMPDKSSCLNNCPRTLPYSACVTICDKMKQACKPKTAVSGGALLTGNVVNTSALLEESGLRQRRAKYKECLKQVRSQGRKNNSFSYLAAFKACHTELTPE